MTAYIHPLSRQHISHTSRSAPWPLSLISSLHQRQSNVTLPLDTAFDDDDDDKAAKIHQSSDIRPSSSPRTSSGELASTHLKSSTRMEKVPRATRAENAAWQPCPRCRAERHEAQVGSQRLAAGWAAPHPQVPPRVSSSSSSRPLPRRIQVKVEHQRVAYHARHRRSSVCPPRSPAIPLCPQRRPFRQVRQPSP